MTDYYVDGAVGNNGNAGTSEGSGNAWLTIDHAASTVAAGDTVYVKATGTYSETVTLDTNGTSTAAISFVGYTSSTTDNGKVTISGGTNCVVGTTFGAYTSFQNFIFTGASSHGVAYGVVDNHSFYNCEFYNNGGSGINGDDNTAFINCEFTNNTGDGCEVDNNNVYVGCVFSGNGGTALDTGTGVNYMHRCVIYNNSTSGDIIFNSVWLLTNCTIDADGSSSDIINNGGSAWIIADNIFHDCGGFAVSPPTIISKFAGYNLMTTSVTTNYAADFTARGTLTGYQDASGAPAFTDEANDDYTLGEASPAIGSGVTPGGIT